MSTTFMLPSDDVVAGTLLYDMLEDSKRARIPLAIEWYLNFHYMRGARYFDSVDYSSGNVVAFYEDLLGAMPFKFEDVLARYQAEIGRILRLDIMPSISQDGVGLMYAAKAATAHVVLDSICRALPMDAIKMDAAEMLVMYGTLGGSILDPYNATNSPDAPDQFPNIELIPPWELLPIPSAPTSTRAAVAVCRQRWVPYDALAEKFAGGKDRIKLPPVTDPFLLSRLSTPTYSTMDGTPIANISPPPSVAGGPPTPPEPSRGATTLNGSPNPRMIYHVPLTEIWVPTPANRLSEYIVMAGKKIILRRDFEALHKKAGKGAKLPLMPLGIATYTGGCGFYGRSFLGPIVNMNAEVESMLLSLMRNVQDMDQFGYTFYPETWGIPRDVLENAKPGRRLIPYNPDTSIPGGDGGRIFQASPVTSGEFPGKMANLGLNLIDRLAGQPSEMMRGEAPGRVDTGKGIDMLYQTSTVPLGAPAGRLADMFSTIYRAMLWHVRDWTAMKVNALSLLDDVVVGIRVDPATGQVKLDKNSIPDPSEVLVSIRSKDPVDKDERRSELIGMLKLNIITPMMFRIINRREGLDFPTGNDVEWQNYQRAVINNILMFNDGVTPGQIFTTDYDVPSIHEYVVLRRIASPEFGLASDAVKAKFDRRLKDLRMLRASFPDQIPYPEDAAVEAERAAAEAERANGGGQPAAPPGMGGQPGPDMQALMGGGGMPQQVGPPGMGQPPVPQQLAPQPSMPHW